MHVLVVGANSAIVKELLLACCDGTRETVICLPLDSVSIMLVAKLSGHVRREKTCEESCTRPTQPVEHVP